MRPLTHHNVTRWLHRLPVIRAVNWDVCANCLLFLAIAVALLVVLFSVLLSTCTPVQARELDEQLRHANLSAYIQEHGKTRHRADIIATILIDEGGEYAEYLAAMVTVETYRTWRTDLVSPMGAVGPFQLMPHACPKHYKPGNWRQGARAAAKHLRQKIAITGSLHGGIRAYCGSGPEAREYLAAVQREWWRGWGR